MVEENKKKNSATTILAILVVLIVIVVGYLLITKNSIVKSHEEVLEKSSDIEIVLERRADLIPNLVNTVKGYASHEEKIIANVTEARQHLLSAGSMTDKATADAELTKALDALLVVVENYPELKANENFINLQDELAGSENRIANARNSYNSAVKEYNTKIQKIPASLVAKMFGYEKENYFKADTSKTATPEVEF